MTRAGARDRFDRLRCRVPGCRATIGGLTGLDELHHLVDHYRLAHGRDIDLWLALEIRAAWEADDEAAAARRELERPARARKDHGR